MVDCRAWFLRFAQRASGGTQKMFSARYSSGSSGSAPSARSASKLGVPLLEGIGDVFQKDETQDDVLVFRRIHRAAQGVGHLPKLALIARRGPVVGFLGLFGFFSRHDSFIPNEFYAAVVFTRGSIYRKLYIVN